MKIVRGIDKAAQILSENRMSSFESVPPHVQKVSDSVFGESLSPPQFVDKVLAEVKNGGDKAIRDLTKKLDGVTLGNLEVSRHDIENAHSNLPNELVESLELAAGRVRRFHEATLPKSWIDSSEGYGELFNAVNRVGIYIPGGNARFPSTVLMSAIPARVAGVKEIILATPASREGLPDPVVLTAADIAGVDRVFQISGAHAIAALAYGTQTVPCVDMVCGPGNIFVTLAKKLVFGKIGVDGLYGPTETLIIADKDTNPTLCAADLVAQAEHDHMATPILITTDEKLAESVHTETKLRAARLERSAFAMTSLDQRGYIAIVETIEEAFKLANQFAPEHISLMLKNPWDYVDQIQNAGAVFVGDFSYEVLGDYVAGPSHIMPTGGTARFSSGLGVRTFLKVSPVIGLTESTSAALGKAASIIARAEGLTGHAEAAEIRDQLR